VRFSSVGLAQMSAPPGTLIAYATAPGQVAREGTGRNGVFTKHLLRHMSTANQPVELTLKRVREGVLADTKGQQVPWDSSSLRGDIVFAGEAAQPGVTVAAVSSPSVDTRMNVERTFWESIKDSRDPKEFDAYIQQFPDGVFAMLARGRLQQLQNAEAAATRAPGPAGAPAAAAPGLAAAAAPVGSVAPAPAPSAPPAGDSLRSVGTTPRRCCPRCLCHRCLCHRRHVNRQRRAGRNRSPARTCRCATRRASARPGPGRRRGALGRRPGRCGRANHPGRACRTGHPSARKRSRAAGPATRARHSPSRPLRPGPQGAVRRQHIPGRTARWAPAWPGEN
jgi:hypothetical protein